MTFGGTSVDAMDAAGAPPPPPPPPGGAVVCADCGVCSFSPNSYLSVTKRTPICDPGIVWVTTTETWPFASADVSVVRWQLDGANWAEFRCDTSQWMFDALLTDLDSGLPCVVSTAPAGYLLNPASPCQGFEFHREVNDDDQVLLKAVLVNNVCTPSEPI